MSLSPDFITQARALAFYRKLKYRRAKRRGSKSADCRGLKGWRLVGSGFYGEVWGHEDHPDIVVKISGRACFGIDAIPRRKPSLDGWPTFAEHCRANPHPNLPKILHFERLSVGISFGIMPRYDKLRYLCDENASKNADVVDEWRDYLEGGNGAPAWMWPIIGMRDALNMIVDLHGDNVMKDPDTGEYIMTDPFSSTSTYDDHGYTWI